MTDEPPVDEPAITVTQPMTEVAPADVKRASAKRYIKAALGAGFEVRCGITQTIEKRPPFKSGEKAGVPRPDVEAEHLWVIGRVPKAATFRLHFKGGSFDHGFVWDAAGWPTELWYDYTPNSRVLAQTKDETDKSWKQRVSETTAHAERQNREYNDGEFWTNLNPRLVTTAADLDEWMADLVPGFVVRKKAVKTVAAPATAKEELMAGVWNG